MKRIIDEIIGHKPVLDRLQRLVSSNKLPGTLILSGPSSVGKYKAALALAQTLFCRQNHQEAACGVCGDCQRVYLEQHEGLKLLKPSIEPIKVEQARQITQFLSLKNEASEHRLVIIDEAEKMNPQSANALLKTLEEPPENCFIVLVTSSLHALLPTIRSRGQIFRFGGLTEAEVRQIVSAPDWVFKVSGGRLDTIARLQDKDYETLFSDLYNSIANLQEGYLQSALSPLQGFIKSKEQCFVLVQSLQSLLQANLWASLNIQDKIAQQLVIDKLSGLGPTLLFDLFFQSVQMESHLKSNFDMLLVFETFFASLNQYFKGEDYVAMDRYSYAP